MSAAGRAPSALTRTSCPGPEQVECYAGARYPERPTALTRGGRRLEVEQVEREWQTPDARHFIARTRAGRFHLAYRENEDQWLIEQV